MRFGKKEKKHSRECTKNTDSGNDKRSSILSLQYIVEHDKIVNDNKELKKLNEILSKQNLDSVTELNELKNLFHIMMTDNKKLMDEVEMLKRMQKPKLERKKSGMNIRIHVI
jgi:hypothetical protein